MRPILLSILCLFSNGLCLLPNGTSERASSQDTLPLDSEAHQLVFHAVLEGLYRDGVSNAVVDAALELDEETRWPRFFIYSCPLCMPAFDAFRTYRGRREFLGRKSRTDTFGPGLVDHVEEALLSEDAAVRSAALRERLQAWIGRRVALMRLTDEEKSRLANDFEDMRKQGLAFLGSYRAGGGALYDHMEYCPSCDGANMALGR